MAAIITMAMVREAAALDVARPLAIYGAAGAADYATTQRAVSRGGVERSMLGPKLGPAVTTAAFLAADLGLQRGGHRRAVVALRVLGAGLMVGIAVNNHWRAR